MEKSCFCGEPHRPGVHHLDRPCIPTPSSFPTAARMLESFNEAPSSIQHKHDMAKAYQAGVVEGTKRGFRTGIVVVGLFIVLMFLVGYLTA